MEICAVVSPHSERSANVVLILSFITILSLSAPSYTISTEDWTIYNTTNSGLSNDAVAGIDVDPQGNIWFATKGGVCSFNGSEWKSWTSVNSLLPNSPVYDIAVAPDSSVWVATHMGIGVFDGKTWSVYNKSNSGLVSDWVSEIEISPKGVVWIGTEGSYVMSFDGKTWQRYNSTNSQFRGAWINDMCLDKSGQPWTAADHYLCGFDGAAWKTYDTTIGGKALGAYSVAIAPDDTIWGSASASLVKWTAEGWDQYTHENSGLPNYVPYDIVFDGSGVLWIASAGLVRFDGNTWQTWNTSNSPLPSNSISRLKFDNAGNLWIATNDKGIAKITLHGTQPSFTVTIDPSLEPNVKTIPRKNDRIRTVGVLQNPGGQRLNIVEQEVVIRTTDRKEIDEFITRRGGTVICDGTIPEPDPKYANIIRDIPPSPMQSYLIEVPIAIIPIENISQDASALQMAGNYRCSSESALKLFALALSEKAQGHDIHMNVVFDEFGCPRTSTKDLPVDPGAPDSTLANLGYMDAFLQPCFNDPSIQLLDAWSLMDLYGRMWRSVPLCVIDNGFNLNDDFPFCVTYDFVGEDFDVNADEVNYHGTGCLSISSALWDNRFGSAGTGAPVTWSMAYRIDYSHYQAVEAIRTAVHWGADVISMSFGSDVGDWGWMSGENELDDAVNHAYDHNVILLAAAGNDSNDLGSHHYIPVEAGDRGKHPIAVGMIDLDTKRAVRIEDGFPKGSNYGSPIDIWAPGAGSVHSIITTPDPNNPSYRSFSGTSCACPYVAGIVAMMRAVNPDISPDRVHDILQSTAISSTDSRVTPGYINAFSAVREAIHETGAIMPPLDDMEPNNSPSRIPIEPGAFCANMHSSDTSDCYWFHIDDFQNVELNIDLLLMGFYDIDYTGGSLSRKALLSPGSYFINLENIGSHPAFYHADLAIDPPVTITGDRYESNDVLADAAELYFNLRDEGSEIYIEDLNFHVNDDQDYYELALPALPDDPLGYDEVVTVFAEPDSIGTYTTFQLTVFDSEGSRPFGRAFEITNIRENFPDGRIRFLVDDYMDHRNFYRLRIGYARSRRGVDPGPSRTLHVIPEWLQNLLATHPLDLPGGLPSGVPLPMRFPSAPETMEAILEGEPPADTPPEILVLRWEETADFGMEITHQASGSNLMFQLIDAAGMVISEAVPQAMKISQEIVETVLRLDIPRLPRGIYGIRVSGKAAAPIPYAMTFGYQGAASVHNEHDSGLPVEAFTLGQNVPNPFNTFTGIPFVLKTSAHVEIIVYNLLGERVAILADEFFPAGLHVIRWNGSNGGGGQAASGVYFVRMITPLGVKTRKMTFMK